LSQNSVIVQSQPPVPPSQAVPFTWPDKIKVVICIPTLQMIDVRFALSLPQFFGSCPPNTSFFADYRYGVAETREQLYHTALTTVPDLTHIFFLDSDVVPDPTLMAQLVSDDKPIVSGVYFNSLYTGISAWKDEMPVPMQNIEKLIEVDKVGMGCCLIQRKVFDEAATLEKPLFYYKIDTKTNSMQSEDFYFFDKIKTIGYKPWVDLRARAIHIKSVGILPEGMIQSPLPPPPPK